MAKRIYSESVKKWATVSGVSATTFIGLLFMYLTFIGAIEITGFSGDQICDGTIEDPCYAYVNLTAKEDIFIYPIGYDPWGRDTVFQFSPGVKDWKLQRSWGSGWRDIPLNETCTGTWCGAPDNKGVAYSYVLREDRDYNFRIVALKNSPYDKIKWAVNYEDREYLDPLWDTQYIIPETEKEILSDEYYQDSLKIYDSLRVPSSDENSYKSYNASEKTLLIEDKDFKIKTKYRLESQYMEKIGPGENVMFAEIAPIEYTDDFYDSIALYSIDDNFEKVEKIIVKKYKNKSIEQSCIFLLNETTNKSEERCVDYNAIRWIEFEKMSEIPIGSNVGLFTDAIIGEHIEWVIEKDGFNFYEWASYLVTNMSAYYKMDESSGTIVDSHGSNNGTYNGALYSQTGALNTAIGFDGTDDYISVGTMGDFGSNMDSNFSISFWINTTTTAGGEICGTNGGSAGSTKYILHMQLNTDSSGGADAGKMFLQLSDIDNTKINAGLTNDETWADGSWHHVVFVVSPLVNDVKIYIDGSSKSVSYNLQQTPDNFANFGTDLWLGAYNVAGGILYADANYDEWGFWNTALDQDAVDDLYGSGTPPEYPFGITPIEITATAEKPDIIYTNTNWLINLTGQDVTYSYFDSYVEFFVNSSQIGTNHTFNMTNNTNHLVATLGHGNFSSGDSLIAQVWLDDGVNTTNKQNITATVQNLNITGTLKDGSSNNLNGSVFIVNQSDNSLVGNTTALNGIWTFGPVNSGTYIITGYKPDNSTFDGDAEPHVVVP